MTDPFSGGKIGQTNQIWMVSLILLSLGALWIWVLWDIASYDDETWRAAGESKTVWFLLVTVLQFFGTLAYLLSTRPKLQALNDR